MQNVGDTQHMCCLRDSYRDQTMRIRLDIAYNGTNFHGWAAQPGQRTVQGEVEQALAAVLREPVTLTVAGRTDAGVHARGQVAHADISGARWSALPGRSDRAPADALVRAANAVLARTAPKPRGFSDVVVHDVTPVPESFDARFSALWRSYVYRIADSPRIWNPLECDVLWFSQRLDCGKMNDAARALIGEHDFIAYAKPREGASTVRTLRELCFDRVSNGEILARVTADAFCHSQVRAMIGTLLDIGRGAKPVSWAGERLAARNHAGMIVAPAHPLTLMEVGYPDSPEEYGPQAQRARVYRG